MAYFANGTEGLIYQETYCFRCQNWGRDKVSEVSGAEGCPIWDAHLCYSYKLCNEQGTPGKEILDELIPMKSVKTKDGLEYHVADQCSMFYPKPGMEIPGQLAIEDVGVTA